MARSRIPQKFIETNETGEDVFSYFRSYYNVSNPHTSGIITITATSTYPPGEHERSDVSTLIREDDGMRWVSGYEENPSFTINFHNNYVDLISYTIISSENIRYIKNWDIFGVSHGKKILIDRRINESFCPESTCSQRIVETYTCQYPGLFNKFIFLHTGPDSLGESLLSMSALKFYGIVSRNYACVSIVYRCSNKNFVNSLIIVLLR